MADGETGESGNRVSNFKQAVAVQVRVGRLEAGNLNTERMLLNARIKRRMERKIECS